jgi:uncharacterized repeat protein (TIGR03943 family)
MLLMGAAVLQTSLTDGYLRFVRPGMRPLLIGASILLLASGAMTLFYQRRRDAAHVDAGRNDNRDDHDDGHHHAHEPRVAWLLLLPVIVLTVAVPQALGADAASRAGTVLRAPTSDFTPLPDGDPVVLALDDYASRAVFDQGRTLEHRSLKMIGFVMLGDDNVVYLARIIVSCCAADGRPIKVGLTGSVPSGLTANSWLTVTGAYTSMTATDPINGGVIPFVDVSSSQPMDQPASPYEN